MEVPCVRVERHHGESVRRDLAEANLLDSTHRITSDENWIYIPVTDPSRVPSRYELVLSDVPVRPRQTMPDDLLETPVSYERLGDIVLLDEDDSERAHTVAEAIMESDLSAKTVLNKRSKVTGERRIRSWDILRGDGTETIHREYGFEYELDVATVYFSPRLATERRRVTQQVMTDEQFFDMFAGVGPFVIPAAARGAMAVGVDINPDAIRYLQKNAQRNSVDDNVRGICGDVSAVAADFSDWADRIVMNLPHRANEFLSDAITIARSPCRLHYYDIQHEDDPFNPGESAIRSAANGLEVEITNRQIVRSYAPHEVNICLDVIIR